MNIQTLKLELVPDSRVPEIKKLVFQPVDITLEDVFHRGLHPYSVITINHENDATKAVDVIVERLNAADAYEPDLQSHDLGSEICQIGAHSYYEPKQPTVQRQLEHVAETVGFLEGLSYDQLVKIAELRLRKIWSHNIAKDFLQNLGRDFAGMREIVKSKNPNVKLCSYEDLNNTDLGTILAVDDFLTADQLLLRYGLPFVNFRKASCLQKITDEIGRLKLTERIERCRVSSWNHRIPTLSVMVDQYCTIQGNSVRWIPHLKNNAGYRDSAKRFAAAWSNGTGRYCFTSTIDLLRKVLEIDAMKLMFPELNYKEPKANAFDSHAKVGRKRITCYSAPVGVYARSSNEELKALLRECGQKQTGRKDELVRRLAETIAEQYAQNLATLDQYFQRNRFIRLPYGPEEGDRFQILQEHKLGPHLVALYCLRHLRGNVVLESRHENNTVAIVDLAEAMLGKKVMLPGSFVPVL